MELKLIKILIIIFSNYLIPKTNSQQLTSLTPKYLQLNFILERQIAILQNILETVDSSTKLFIRELNSTHDEEDTTIIHLSTRLELTYNPNLIIIQSDLRSTSLSTSSESHEWKKLVQKYSNFYQTIILFTDQLTSPTFPEEGGPGPKLKFRINSKFYPVTKSNEDLYIFSTNLNSNDPLNDPSLKIIEDNVKSLQYSYSLIFVRISRGQVNDPSILLAKKVLIPGPFLPYKIVAGDGAGATKFKLNWGRSMTQTRTNLQGGILRVSVMSAVPARVTVKKCQNEPKCFLLDRGMYSFVIKEFEKRLNFTSIVFPGGGTGGTGNLINGTWSGVMGDIVANRAEIGFCAGETWERHQYTVMAALVEIMVLTFVTGRQPPIFVWQAIFWPLSITVWVTCGVIFVFGYWTMTLLIKSKSRRVTLHDHLNAVDFIVGSFLEKGYQFSKQSTLKLKIFVSFWALAGLTMATVYKGKLVGVLAFPLYPSAPKSFDQLSMAKDYQWALRFYGGLAYDLIKRSMNPTMIRIASQLELEPDARKCFQRALDSKFGCITYGAMAEFEIIKNFTGQFGQTDISIAQSREYFVPVGPILTRRSNLLKTFIWAIGCIWEAGLTEYWIKLDYDNVRMASAGNSNFGVGSKTDENNNLTMKNFKGAMVIFCSGIISSFIIFTVEMLLIYFRKLSAKFKTYPARNEREGPFTVKIALVVASLYPTKNIQTQFIQ